MMKIEEMPESIRIEFERRYPDKSLEETVNNMNNLSWNEFCELAKKAAKYLEDCFEKDKEDRLNQQIERLKKFPV